MRLWKALLWGLLSVFQWQFGADCGDEPDIKNNAEARDLQAAARQVC